MKTEDAISFLWQTAQKGQAPVAFLHKTLSMDEAYRVQLGILSHWQAKGEKLGGWKIGLSAAGARQAFGLSAPISAYLLASRHFSSGHTFSYAAISKPVIESELCFTIGKRLAGPGVTREQVLVAVSAVAPAFEVVDMRFNIGEDMPLGVADGIAQWGYVTGIAVSPYPAQLELGEVTVEMRRNSEVFANVVGKDVIDNQLDCIAWLANHLSTLGLTLEPGQDVMTGSFTKPTPIAKGDRWESTFSGVGAVSATFA
ncbi:MAG: 2-keto-4-pentenoate hydratase [Candidatus Binatia bacterium]